MKAWFEYLEMAHMKNLSAIKTGTRELPTLPVAYLHQRLHYEIWVTVTWARPMIFFGVGYEGTAKINNEQK
jgi:hypothetical protein